MLSRPHSPFWIFTIALCVALLLPALVQDGMFIDGNLYASVSKNLAEGRGTFWEPTFSQTAITAFHEQPPLMFGLQSLFFKVFGGIWPERIYSALTALIGLWLLARLWKVMLPADDPLNNSGWLALFFYFVMPVTFYTYTNNLEECTMTLFVLAAVLNIVQAMRNEKNSGWRLLFAGAWLVCAGLTKGVQGLFPVIAVGLWWIVFRDRSFLKMLLQSFLLVLPLLLFIAYAYLDETVRASFEAYFGSRFTKTFAHVHDTSDSRFKILWELFIDVALPLAITVVCWLIYRSRPGKRPAPFRLALFLLLLSFSGILPLMITLEQRGFYLVTALPYLAAAFALIAAPALARPLSALSARPRLVRTLSIVSLALLLGAFIFTFTQIGKTKRDADLLHDIRALKRVTGEGITITVANSIWNDWSLQTYAMRFATLSLDGETGLGTHPYFLAPKTQPAPPPGYVQVDVPLRKYCLFRLAH